MGDKMVPIRYNLCDPSMYQYKCPFVTEKDGICVHNTGMPSPASNEISYMIRNTNQVSFHAAVDEKEIVVGVPFKRNVWASGDGHGAGNFHKIQIEICRSTNENEELFRQAEKNAAEWIAHLLIENGWGLDRVFKHQDFDGKYCPHKTLDWGWQRFLDMIKSFMDKEKEEEEMPFTYDDFKVFMDKYKAEVASWENPPEWGKEAWDKMTESGLMDGKRPYSSMSRVEFATVMNRLDNMADEEVEEDK